MHLLVSEVGRISFITELPRKRLQNLKLSYYTKYTTICNGPLEHWDRGFESHSGHLVPHSFMIMLWCVSTGLTMGPKSIS